MILDAFKFPAIQYLRRMSFEMTLVPIAFLK
jgi:hypothetical protein